MSLLTETRVHQMVTLLYIMLVITSTTATGCDTERFLDCAKQVAASHSTWRATPVNCRSILNDLLESQTFQSENLIPVCRSYMETNMCAEQYQCDIDEILNNIDGNNANFPPDLKFCYETSRNVCTDASLAPSPFHTCIGCTNCCKDCFNDDAVVSMEDGRRLQMTQLSVGDRVLTVDSDSGTPYYDEVIAFLHRAEDNSTLKKFIQIVLANNAAVHLSPHHLIYVASREEMLHAMQNNQTNFGQPKFAADVKPGDHVFTVTENESTRQSSEVLAVNLKFQFSGLYAPLTSSGNIVVDGVLMSCYASYSSHEVAHWSMVPLRAYRRISSYFSSLLSLSDNWLSTHTSEGVHRYADVLRQVSDGTFRLKRLFGFTSR